jgi:hypothetical protein
MYVVVTLDDVHEHTLRTRRIDQGIDQSDGLAEFFRRGFIDKRNLLRMPSTSVSRASAASRS